MRSSAWVLLFACACHDGRSPVAPPDAAGAAQTDASADGVCGPPGPFTEVPGVGTPLALTPDELGARLAHALWRAPPDDALLSELRRCPPASREAVEGLAVRMLQDPRAESALSAFVTRWLSLEALLRIEKADPAFTPSLRRSMVEEPRRLFRHVLLRGDAKLETFLSAPSTFVDSELAAIYGVEPGDGTFRLIELDPRQRAGVLTQAGFLTLGSLRDRTSPSVRGLAVRQTFVCQSIPAHPPDADRTLPMPEATMRQRVSAAVKGPVCGGCHELFDRIGFALETYDVLGRFRTHENGQLIDASGETDFEQRVIFTDGAEMARALGKSAPARKCFALNWMEFVLGRSVGPQEHSSLVWVAEALIDDGDMLRAMVRATTSAAFLASAPVAPRAAQSDSR